MRKNQLERHRRTGRSGTSHCCDQPCPLGQRTWRRGSGRNDDRPARRAIAAKARRSVMLDAAIEIAISGNGHGDARDQDDPEQDRAASLPMPSGPAPSAVYPSNIKSGGPSVTSPSVHDDGDRLGGEVRAAGSAASTGTSRASRHGGRRSGSPGATIAAKRMIAERDEAVVAGVVGDRRSDRGCRRGSARRLPTNTIAGT